MVLEMGSAWVMRVPSLTPGCILLPSSIVLAMLESRQEESTNRRVV